MYFDCRSYVFFFVCYIWILKRCTVFYVQMQEHDFLNLKGYLQTANLLRRYIISTKVREQTSTVHSNIWYFPLHRTSTQLNIYIIHSENYSRTICFVSRRERECSNWKENKVFGEKPAAKLKFADCTSWLCNVVTLAEHNLFLDHACILFQWIYLISYVHDVLYMIFPCLPSLPPALFVRYHCLFGTLSYHVFCNLSIWHLTLYPKYILANLILG